MYESTYEVPRILKFIETEGRIVVARGEEGRGLWSYCFMGTEALFGMMKKFWG